MKKLMYYLLLFLGFGHFTKAQIQQGTKMAGGNISFYSTTYSSKGTYNGTAFNDVSNSSTQLLLAPKAGLMLTDNIMVGTGVNLSTGEGYSFALSPFGRYYFPAGDRFYAFGEISLVLAKSTSFNIGGGASYFIKDNVAIEGLITFNKIVHLGIGLQFYFD